MSEKKIEGLSYGTIIYQSRKRKGISRNALAQLAGVSRKSLFNYEHYSAVPNVEQLSKIAKALGAEIVWREHDI